MASQSTSALANSTSGIVLKMLKVPCTSQEPESTPENDEDEMESQQQFIRQSDDFYTKAKAKIEHRQKGASSQQSKSRINECIASFSAFVITIMFFFYVTIKEGKSDELVKMIYDLKNISRTFVGDDGGNP